MRMNPRLKVVGATSLIWILCLSACGSIQITTWFTDASQVDQRCQGESPLIRRDANGTIEAALTILQADGYLCYSPADDKTWRDKLDLCCAQAGIK